MTIAVIFPPILVVALSRLHSRLRPDIAASFHLAPNGDTELSQYEFAIVTKRTAQYSRMLNVLSVTPMGLPDHRMEMR
jgi:hypothetical protein